MPPISLLPLSYSLFLSVALPTVVCKRFLLAALKYVLLSCYSLVVGKFIWL